MSLFFGIDWGSWIVVHARGEAVCDSSSLPSESVWKEIARLSRDKPFNVEFQIVIDTAKEFNELVLLGIFELFVTFDSVQKIVKEQVLTWRIGSAWNLWP